jgi:hypothetical protein
MGVARSMQRSCCGTTIAAATASKDVTDVNDASAAYQKLTEMAEDLHHRSPTLTVSQAFARVFEDQANSELAARAHRRPMATTSYAFPR